MDVNQLNQQTATLMFMNMNDEPCTALLECNDTRTRNFN